MQVRSLLASAVLAVIPFVAHADDATQPAAGDMKVVKTFTLGGKGRWDLMGIDSDARRLYIPRSDHVMVMDIDTGLNVGEIPDTPGVHGVAIAADLHKGFTTNAGNKTVTVFDTQNLKTLASVPTGDKPDAIVYDPASQRVFVFNGKSKNATVINAADNSVAGTVDVGGAPELPVSDGQGKVFVNLEDKSEIVEIDSKNLKVLNHWALTPGEEPTGLAIDAKNHRLFSACHNETMVIMDADSGKVITTAKIGKGVDGAEFDPDSNNAYSSNGEGSITVVHEDDPNTFKVTQTIPTKSGARTIILDAKTHQLYLPTAEFEPVKAPTTETDHPRPRPREDSFMILVVGK